MKILIADDSEIIRRIIREAAGDMGIMAEEAESGAGALELLAEKHAGINLLLLDWNMPGVGGTEVLQEMKKHHLYKNIPVVMMTTESEKESIIAAIRAGADNYITKPFSMEEIAEKINQCARED